MPFRRTAGAVLAVAAATLAAAAPASALPDCRPVPKARTILETGHILENVYVDGRGRIFYSDESDNALMRLDRIGGKPRKLTAVTGPGGITPLDGGTLVVGYGDTPQNGIAGDQTPSAGLYRVNPDSGAKSILATGTGMSNGVTRGADGAIYATNDLGRLVDRVRGGKVEHGWAEVQSGNGIVVSLDNRYVYVAQTFAPAAIQRITRAHPSQVSPFFEAPAEDSSAGLDSMTQDGYGNLYVAANGAGEVWRVNRDAKACVLARGLSMPSAVAFGDDGFGRNLYVSAFGGQITQLKAAAPPLPCACPGHAPATHGRVVGRVRGAHGRRAVVTLRRHGEVVRRRRGHRYRWWVRGHRRYRLHARVRGRRCRDRIVRVRVGRTVRRDLRCRPRRSR
jgi:sugar lactone lactonase YvrE